MQWADAGCCATHYSWWLIPLPIEAKAFLEPHNNLSIKETWKGWGRGRAREVSAGNYTPIGVPYYLLLWPPS